MEQEKSNELIALATVVIAIGTVINALIAISNAQWNVDTLMVGIIVAILAAIMGGIITHVLFIWKGIK